MDAVVPYISHSAQDDALGVAGGSPVVSGAQLSQNRNQRVPDEGVDLVDQEHQRMRAGQGPLGKHPLERSQRPRHLKCVAPSVAHELVVEHELGA